MPNIASKLEGTLGKLEIQQDTTQISGCYECKDCTDKVMVGFFIEE